MNEHKIFAQRIGLIGITNLLVSLSGIILLPILTKNIPIEDYGVWVQINVTIGLIPAIVMLGLPYTMVRFLAAAKTKEDIQEGFYSIAFYVALISGIVSSILFMFSEPLAVYLFDENIVIAKLVPALVFVACINTLLLNYFRTFQQIKRYALRLFMQTYLNVAFVAYFVLTGHGILGAVLGHLISNFVLLVIIAPLIYHEIGFKLPKFRRMKEYLKFGLPTVPGNLSSWVVNSSDRYVIGIFLGTAFVGYYSPGYTLGNIINMFMAPLSFLLPAVLSRYYDVGNLSGVKTVFKYSLKYFLLLAIPAAFGLSLLSKPILTILSTPEIASQGYLITPFVAVSALFFGMRAVMTHVFLLVKRTDIGAKIWILAAILNFVLNIILIPYIGILGAAITTLTAYALSCFLGVFYAFKYFKFDIDLGFISKSIFASIVMSLVIIKWYPAGLLDILILIGISAVVYAAILLLLKSVKKEEIMFFRELFKV